MKLPPTRKAFDLPILTRSMIEAVICGIGENISISEIQGEGGNVIYFLPQATREFRHIVSYGRRSPMNHNEQKLQGYGQSFQDMNGNIYHVVAHVIEIPTKNCSEYHAGVLEKDGSWNAGMDFLNYYRSEYIRFEEKYNTDEYGNTINPFLGYGHSRYIANIHTHPGIGVFFSKPDRINGKARASCFPVATMVADPIRKTILAGIGKDLKETRIVFYDTAAPNIVNTASGQKKPYKQRAGLRKRYNRRTVYRKFFRKIQMADASTLRWERK